MSTICVQDVAEHTVETLKIHAARSGQSLESYIRQLLEREAELVPPEEAAAEARQIAARSLVTANDVCAAVSANRTEHPAG